MYTKISMIDLQLSAVQKLHSAAQPPQQGPNVNLVADTSTYHSTGILLHKYFFPPCLGRPGGTRRVRIRLSLCYI
jgi:hypothetical protein